MFLNLWSFWMMTDYYLSRWLVIIAFMICICKWKKKAKIWNSVKISTSMQNYKIDSVTTINLHAPHPPVQVWAWRSSETNSLLVEWPCYFLLFFLCLPLVPCICSQILYCIVLVENISRCSLTSFITTAAVQEKYMKDDDEMF